MYSEKQMVTRSETDQIRIMYRNLRKAAIDEVEEKLERLDAEKGEYFRKRWEMAQKLTENEFIRFILMQEQSDACES